MIKVTNDYFIDSDKYCYSVNKRMVGEESKKEYFITLAYPTTIKGCIEYIMKLMQKEKCSENLSLHYYLQECKQINEEMNRILKGIQEVETL